MEKGKLFKDETENHELIIKIELLILAVYFVIGVSLFIGSVPVIKEAVVFATTAKPETFTELYFEDHTNLPKTIKKDEKYSFIFTIHNVEYKDIEYSYVVYLQTNDQKTILDQGKFNLKDNEFKSVKEDFTLLENLRSKIVVEIINKNQNISFWMDN